jgi:hypothetical protein
MLSKESPYFKAKQPSMERVKLKSILEPITTETLNMEEINLNRNAVTPNRFRLSSKLGIIETKKSHNKQFKQLMDNNVSLQM